MIKHLIKIRFLEKFRIKGKRYQVVFDGTGICSFKKRHCKNCLKKTFKNKETGKETTFYYHNVLEAKWTTFMWISSYRVKSRKDVKEIAGIGRKRWKIENEGFNVQKNKGYELQHLFSKNKTAMKNHKRNVLMVNGFIPQ